jgi:hypothetical protein
MTEPLDTDEDSDADERRARRRRIIEEGRCAAYYTRNPYECLSPEAGLWSYGHRQVPEPLLSDDSLLSWHKGTLERILNEGRNADLDATTPYVDSKTKTLVWRVGHEQMRLIGQYSLRSYRPYLLAREDCPPELRSALEARDPEDRGTAWVDNLPPEAYKRALEFFRLLKAEVCERVNATYPYDDDDD